MLNYNYFKNKKVLITGHTGFKGSWLAFWLNLIGSKVIGFSLKPNKNQKLYRMLNLKKKVTNCFGDIRNEKKLQFVIKKYKPDLIFHLAAQPILGDSYIDPKYTYETNSIGTLNLLECLRKNKKIKSCIFVTSDKCYYNKETRKGYKESDKLGGKDPYSGSKASAEIIFQSYYHSFFKDTNLPGIATARAGNVIGGGDFTKYRLIPDIIKSVLGNKPIKVKNPNSTRPWQHILDPLNGYLLLSYLLVKNKKKFNGASYNFGPKKRSIKKVMYLVKEIKKRTNFKKEISIRNKDGFKESNLLSLNITKAIKEMKWAPKLSIDESLKLTLDWYLEMKKKNKNFQGLSEKQIRDYMRRT